MKRFMHVHGAKAAAAALLLITLTGCTADTNGLVTVFELVQTILLGVTAAASYTILREF